jgi:hypothetical protein
MEEEVKVHTVGKIEHGKKYQGWYVFVQTYRTSEACVVLVSNNEMFGKDENGELIGGAIGYDNWVPDKETLVPYFRQYDWKVNWLDEKKAGWLPNVLE